MATTWFSVRGNGRDSPTLITDDADRAQSWSERGYRVTATTEADA